MIVKLPTLGLVCPFPLVEAKEAIAKLKQKAMAWKLSSTAHKLPRPFLLGLQKKVMK